MIVLLEEVLAHELLQAPAEVVLALRDQRRVRDRQPERVLEQRRHREPVRDRAHHRRLGAGVHEARGSRPGPAWRRTPPRRTAAARPRRCASGAAPRAALGVGGGVAGDHRDAAGSGPSPCRFSPVPDGPASARIARHASHRPDLRHVRRLPRRTPAGDRARGGARRPAGRRGLRRRAQPAQEGPRAGLQPGASGSRSWPRSRRSTRSSSRRASSSSAHYIEQYAADVLVMGDDWAGQVRRVRGRLRGRLPAPHAGDLDDRADREDLGHQLTHLFGPSPFRPTLELMSMPRRRLLGCLGVVGPGRDRRAARPCRRHRPTPDRARTRCSTARTRSSTAGPTRRTGSTRRWCCATSSSPGRRWTTPRSGGPPDCWPGRPTARETRTATATGRRPRVSAAAPSASTTCAGPGTHRPTRPGRAPRSG